MNLTMYLAAGGLAASALIYGAWTWDSRTKTAQIEASAVMIDVQAKDIARAKDANDASLASLAKMKADLERQKAVTAAAQASDRKRAAALSTALKRINDAPKSDDGDLAPVLRRELNGLRVDGGSAAPADGADKDPAGSATDRDSPDVPAPPGAPGS